MESETFVEYSTMEFLFYYFAKKGIISFDLETGRSSQKSRSLSKAVISLETRRN